MIYYALVLRVAIQAFCLKNLYRQGTLFSTTLSGVSFVRADKLFKYVLAEKLRHFFIIRLQLVDDIPNIGKRICDSCGKKLPDGELFYHCRAELIATKDAGVPDLKHPDRLIAQALSEIAGKDEHELLDDIYQELILQLCPDCRVELLKLIHGLLNKGCKNCPNCAVPTIKKKGKLLQFPSKNSSR